MKTKMKIEDEERDVEDLWHGFSHALRRFLRARLHNDADAEDVLQDVFIKIHRHAQTLPRAGKLRPWLYAIARNALVDHVRRRRPTAELPEDLAEKDRRDDGETNRAVATWLGPMVASLPPAYREAIQRVELDGLSQVDLASELGLSVAGAKSRVQRGRKLLREQLLACCHLEFDRRGGVIDWKSRASCCDAACEPACDDPAARDQADAGAPSACRPVACRPRS